MSFKYDGKSRPPNKAFDKGMNGIQPIKKDKDGNEIKCSTCKFLGKIDKCKYCGALTLWKLDDEDTTSSRT